MGTKTLHLKHTSLKEKDKTVVSYKKQAGVKSHSRLISLPIKKIVKKKEPINNNRTEVERYKETFLKKFYDDIQKYRLESFDKLNIFIEELKKRYSSVYCSTVEGTRILSCLSEYRRRVYTDLSCIEEL